MTDTPRTDNLARGNHVVPTSWAEELERELNDAIETMKRTGDNASKIIASQADENILLAEQRDELENKLEKSKSYKNVMKRDNAELRKQLDRLAEVIRLTLMENLHLADGDQCTLKRLKDAIGFDLDSLENASVEAK